MLSNNHQDDNETQATAEQCRFDARVLELLRYRAQHGSCRVPRDPKSSFYQWLVAIRRAYRQGALSADRIRLLESLDFEWEQKTGQERLNSQQAQQWEERFAELEQYKQQHGHANVPKEQGELGKWVQLTRNHYRQARRRKHDIGKPGNQRPA